MNLSSSRILVVDDDPAVRFFLEEALEQDGYIVTALDNGTDAIAHCEKQLFDLALLDLKMDDMDGMALLLEIKKRSPTIAVILLTGHASLESAVEALRQGASDYLFKPCKLPELRQSVSQALQKRQQAMRQQTLMQKLEQTFSEHLMSVSPVPTAEVSIPAADPDDETRFLRNGTLIIDLVRHAVTLDGILLELSPTEFNLLVYLVRQAPRVIAPHELMQKVQGYTGESWESRDLARFHIYRLRQKIKAATGRSDLVVTARGVGYSIFSA